MRKNVPEDSTDFASFFYREDFTGLWDDRNHVRFLPTFYKRQVEPVTWGQI